MDAGGAATRLADANRVGRVGRVSLGAAPAALVAVFTVWPVVTLVARVVRPQTWDSLRRLHGLAGLLWFTTWQAVVSTVLALAVGLWPAWVLATRRLRGRGWCRAALVVPFFLPTVVVAAALRTLLPTALLDTPVAIITAHVFLNVAVVVQVVGALAATVPDDLAGAAATLGASPLQTWRTVLWPALRPAVIGAAIVVFAFCFLSYGAALLLGGPRWPTVEVEIVRRATQLGDVQRAAALSLVQLALVAAVFGLGAWWQQRARLPLSGAVHLRRAGPAQRAAVWLVAALFVVPLLSLALSSVYSGHWTARGWRHLTDSDRRGGIGVSTDVGRAVSTSLWFALVATAITVVVGTLAAMSIHLARRWAWLLDVGLALPLAISAVTVGLGMLITFDRAPFDWRARWWLIPVGQAMVALPFAVRSLLGVLRAVPDDQRAAAATLGASPWRAVWEVDGRALWRPIVASAGIAAAMSLGEFGATSVLSRSGNETLPIAIGRLLGRTGTLPRLQASALATMLAALCVTLVVGSGALARWHRRDQP